jgi:hypothetical protein
VELFEAIQVVSSCCCRHDLHIALKSTPASSFGRCELNAKLLSSIFFIIPQIRKVFLVSSRYKAIFSGNNGNPAFTSTAPNSVVFLYGIVSNVLFFIKKDHGFLNKLVFSLTLSVGITAVTAQVQPAVKKQANAPALNDTAFVNLKEYSNDFVYDMKYATEDNFFEAKVYDCAVLFAPENSCCFSGSQ